jgi:hypothetical protein
MYVVIAEKKMERAPKDRAAQAFASAKSTFQQQKLCC